MTDPDPLADLVRRFSAALLDKLRDAERKYGHNDSWLEDDWPETLRLKLREHVEKGDPRDVAAYCAFAWHHGWSIAAPQATDPREATEAMYEAAYDATRLPDGTPQFAEAGFCLSHAAAIVDAALAAAPQATDPRDADRRLLDDAATALKATEERALAAESRIATLTTERDALFRKPAPDATDWKARCEAVGDEKYNEGRDDAADMILIELAKALGLETFEVHDGTEEWEGDVFATLHGILHAAKVVDEEAGELCTTALTAAQAENEKLRAALIAAREAILSLRDTRWSEAEGTDDEWVGYIDYALSPLSPEKP